MASFINTPMHSLHSLHFGPKTAIAARLGRLSVQIRLHSCCILPNARPGRDTHFAHFCILPGRQKRPIQPGNSDF